MSNNRYDKRKTSCNFFVLELIIMVSFIDKPITFITKFKNMHAEWLQCSSKILLCKSTFLMNSLRNIFLNNCFIRKWSSVLGMVITVLGNYINKIKLWGNERYYIIYWLNIRLSCFFGKICINKIHPRINGNENLNV